MPRIVLWTVVLPIWGMMGSKLILVWQVIHSPYLSLLIINFSNNCDGHDDGDCINFNEKYQNCTIVRLHYIGDHYCDGGKYNTIECGYNGGDCLNLFLLQL